MHIYTEAKSIAQEAWEEAQEQSSDLYDIQELALEYIHNTCDGHEVAIYYHKAIRFCVDQDTSDGEDFLEDCGSLVKPSDTFRKIACRIAYATLYCAAMECLQEIADNYEEEEES